MSPIELVLRAVGADGVADAFTRISDKATAMSGNLKAVALEASATGDKLDDVADHAEKIGTALDKAGDAFKGATDDIKHGADGVEDSLKGIENEAERMADAFRNLGSDNGVEKLSEEADQFQNKIEESKAKVSGLISTLEGVRNAGMALTAAGAGGLLLSKQFQESFREGQNAQLQMEAMLRKRGEEAAIPDMNDWAGKLSLDAFMDDDDPIKQAAAKLLSFGFSAERVKEIMPGLIGQTRLMAAAGEDVGAKLQGTATAMGKAFAGGKASALTRIGVTLDPGDIKRLNGMEKAGASFAAQQAAMLEVINKSMADYALKMDEGLSDADKKLNLMKNSFDSLSSSIGEGSQDAQNSINGIVASIFDLANASPEIARLAGYWGTYGAYALTAAGSVLTVGSQVAITAASMKALGITGSTAMGLIRAGALAAGGSILALTAAALLAVAAIGLAIYSWNANKDKILNPTASYDDKRSDQQREDDAQKKETLDDIRARSRSLPARDRYIVDRKLASAYKDLGEIDAAGELTSEFVGIRRGLPKGKDWNNTNNRDAQIFLRNIRGLNTGKNAGDRMSGDDFNAWSKSRAERDAKDTASSVDSIQKRADKLQDLFSGAGAAPAPSPALPGDEDLSGLSIDQLQMRQAQMKLRTSKNPAAARLQYEMFLRRRAEKQGRASEKSQREQEREQERAEREEQQQARRDASERKKALAATAKAGREQLQINNSRVKEALYMGAHLDDNGQLVVPPDADVTGIEGDLRSELLRKDRHDQAFHLGKYKPVKERSSRDGSGSGSPRSGSGRSRSGEGGLSSGELLRYVERGGSLFNVPGRTGRGSSGSGGSGDDGEERGPRTGQLALRETGRKRNADGTERVTVTGTLDLTQPSGTLQKAAMGFRVS